MEVKECTVVVTGGASGLGEACVRQLIQNGARVAVLDLAEERGMQLASELGDSAIFCKTDVSDANSVQQAVDKTIDSFGAIHVAISCAGLVIPSKVLGKEGPLPIDKFNLTIQVNLIGTMNVIRLAAEKMVLNSPNKDGEKGVVINTASIAAFEGQIGQAAYSASKAGIVGMTIPIAREFADYGIRVLTIAPGLFNTPMLAGLPEKAKESLVKTIPFPKRLAEPSEYAQLAMHIIENPILNGETIRLDSAIRMAAK
ncbi:MAG: 3-hydroxyacyl-CoA dehydrogenase [Desulfobacteraceae bacterium]|nr:3-hydroxyacyl-CoA dehydrogenase [Desulfobacteraceae bacterium]